MDKDGYWHQILSLNGYKDRSCTGNKRFYDYDVRQNDLNQNCFKNWLPNFDSLKNAVFHIYIAYIEILNYIACAFMRQTRVDKIFKKYWTAIWK